jgi:outer membrane murein-binding lipoprotein Lpp
MKPFSWVVVLVLILAILSGCTSNSKYQAAINDNATLSSQVADLNGQVSNLNAQVTDLQGKYDKIAKVYPPRDFATLQELKDWLTKDPTNALSPAATIEIQYSRGLAQQFAALKDGFIISIDQEFVNDAFFFIFGTTIINGEMWVWDIKTDEPYQPIGFGQVTRSP